MPPPTDLASLTPLTFAIPIGLVAADRPPRLRTDAERDTHPATLRLRISPASFHWRGARTRQGDRDDDRWLPVVARLPKGRGFLAGVLRERAGHVVLEPRRWPTAADAAIRADRIARDTAGDVAPDPEPHSPGDRR